MFSEPTRTIGALLVLTVSLLFAASPLSVRAQVTQTPVTQTQGAPTQATPTQVIDGAAPLELQAEVFDFLNAPEVLRITGGTRVPAGMRLEGDVAILGGFTEVGGAITGRLLVVNGDLRLLPGSEIGGAVLVLGGVLSGEEEAPPAGGATVYTLPLRYRARAGRIEPAAGRDLSGVLGSDLGFGYARLGLRTREAYNRVEGLPVSIGPMIRTSGSNPLALDLFAIWRSVNGLTVDSDDLGYSLTLRQGLGGRGAMSFGASAFDEVAAIESQGFSRVESGLSTFFLRADLRDYYERKGWSAFFEVHPSRAPLQLSLTLRDERHTTPPVRNPWTLRGDEHRWRPLPLAGEGSIRSVEAALLWNSRDDEIRPSDGWAVEARILRQTGGELRSRPTDPDDPDLEAALASPEAPEAMKPFTRATIDVRRYARVSPSTRLLLRGFAGSSTTDSPLPPQFQMALGGEGSLPGYRRFSSDCGARTAARIAPLGEGEDPRQRFYPSYGCDGVLLFQAELQKAFSFSWNPLPESWENSEASTFFEFQPIWALTFNAGRGWAKGEVGNGHPRVDSPTHADVGVGFFLGGLGLYWSYPLTDRSEGVNFYVRLQRRF